MWDSDLQSRDQELNALLTEPPGTPSFLPFKVLGIFCGLKDSDTNSCYNRLNCNKIYTLIKYLEFGP